MPSRRNKPADLPERLRAGAARLASHHGYCVAFSGGRDSTALLHAARCAGLKPLRAIHIHHGLMPQADAWAEHAGAVAGAMGVPLTVQRVTVASRGEGVEAAARDARYRALAKLLQPDEVLMTAHHADDQAETVLHRLLRGAGLHGLAGIPGVRPFADGWLWRPLLATPRTDIEAWCAEQGLDWVEDPGNHDGSNTRSRLRALLPAMEAAVPGARTALARLAEHAGEQAALIDALLAPELEARMEEGTLSIDGLMQQAAPHRHALLRLWCDRLGAPRPGVGWLERCDVDLLGAAPDRQPRLALGALFVQRFGGRLWLRRPLAPVPEDWQTAWQGGTLDLPGDAGRLSGPAKLPAGCAVRFVRAGERLRPPGATHRRRVKHLFQEWGVPPWERRRTPLILLGETPVQLGNRSLDDAIEAFGAIRWTHPRWHLQSP